MFELCDARREAIGAFAQCVDRVEKLPGFGARHEQLRSCARYSPMLSACVATLLRP